MQCSIMGVFAPLTGIVGTMQAMEAMKLVTGVGETLAERCCSSTRRAPSGAACGSRRTRLRRLR